MVHVMFVKLAEQQRAAVNRKDLFMHKPSYSQNISKQISDFLYDKLCDVFFCGLDKDGNRMYRIKIGFTQRMPMRQRYDRYLGMMGFVEDIKGSLTQSWFQYSQFREEQQQNQKLQKKSGLQVQQASLEENLDDDQMGDDDD